MELQTLDQQLKVAIQNHQILVAKMKSDPQNGNLQKMLHDLQSRIRTLSEKQKQVVQQLRKDLEIKKQQATGSGATNNNNNSNTNNNHQAAVVNRVGVVNSFTQPTAVNSHLTQQMMPLSLTMKQVDSSRFTTILLPAKVTLSPAPINCIGGGGSANGSDQKTTTTTQLVTLTTTLLPPNSTPTAIIYRPQQVENNSPRVTGPPPPTIRVPQYPPLRPAVTPNTSSSSTSSPVVQITHSTSSTTLTHSITTTAHSNNVNLKSTNNALKPSNKNNITHSGDKSKSSVLDPDLQKKKFMAALGLITHDMVTELKSRKSERKRRTTANPQFSYGNWDHHSEKKSSTHYLASPLPPGFKRPRGRPRLGSTTPSGSRPSTPEDHVMASSDALSFMRVIHNGLLSKEENVCVICRSKGELMNCSVCLLGYHSTCLQQSSSNEQPQQATTPAADPQWICPNCLLIKKKNNQWPRSLAMVHSYILHKTAKEEEKRQLIQRGTELRVERDELEQRSKQLTDELSSQVKARTELLLDSKTTLESIEQLKTSVRLLQTS